MLVTTQWMAENYAKYNQKYWGGKLPNISFYVNKSKKTWGFASYRYMKVYNTRYDWEGNKYDYYDIEPISITLSNYYDSPEKVKLTTLLHEMIHIADYTFHPEHFGLVKNGRKSKRGYDAHGNDFFLPEARRLAADGWDIEKYVTMEEIGASQISDEINAINQRTAKKGFIAALFMYGNGQYRFMKTNKENYEDLNGHNLDWFKRTTSEYPIYRVEWYLCHLPEIASLRAFNRGWKAVKIPVEGLADKLRQTGTLLKVVDIKDHVDNNQPSQNVDPNIISHFRMPLLSGKVIDLRNISKDDLFNKLKNSFPKWSDDIINKQIENPKWRVNEMKRINLNKIIQEELDNFINKNSETDDPTANIVGTTHIFHKELGDGEGIVSIE